MANDPYFSLVFCAADLKRAAPSEYDQFLKTVKQLAEHRKNELVAADRKFILGAQGRSQALEELVKKLENCTVLETQFRSRK